MEALVPTTVPVAVKDTVCRSPRFAGHENKVIQVPSSYIHSPLTLYTQTDRHKQANKQKGQYNRLRLEVRVLHRGAINQIRCSTKPCEDKTITQYNRINIYCFHSLSKRRRSLSENDRRVTDGAPQRMRRGL